MRAIPGLGLPSLSLEPQRLRHRVEAPVSMVRNDAVPLPGLGVPILPESEGLFARLPFHEINT